MTQLTIDSEQFDQIKTREGRTKPQMGRCQT
jgi:hypothetical protein